jgi:hypothetical protein
MLALLIAGLLQASIAWAAAARRRPSSEAPPRRRPRPTPRRATDKEAWLPRWTRHRAGRTRAAQPAGRHIRWWLIAGGRPAAAGAAAGAAAAGRFYAGPATRSRRPRRPAIKSEKGHRAAERWTSRSADQGPA